MDTFELALHDAGLTDIHSGGAKRARSFMTTFNPPENMLPSIYSVQNHAIPGPAGQIPIRI